MYLNKINNLFYILKLKIKHYCTPLNLAKAHAIYLNRFSLKILIIYQITLEKKPKGFRH